MPNSTGNCWSVPSPNIYLPPTQLTVPPTMDKTESDPLLCPPEEDILLFSDDEEDIMDSNNPKDMSSLAIADERNKLLELLKMQHDRPAQAELTDYSISHSLDAVNLMTHRLDLKVQDSLSAVDRQLQAQISTAMAI